MFGLSDPTHTFRADFLHFQPRQSAVCVYYTMFIVYFYLCFLLPFYCQPLSQDYSNDYPASAKAPNIEQLRYKSGAEFTLKCNNDPKHRIHWQFLPCSSNFKGVQCDDRIQFDSVASNTAKWYKFKTRKRLKIQNANETHIGVYRCMADGAIIKIFKVDVIDNPASGSNAPKIVALNPAETFSIAANSALRIECKATSYIPPVVQWLKDCNGKTCEINLHNNCYCFIPNVYWNNSVHIIDDNLYLSKLILHNAKAADSGLYTCLALSTDGKDYRNVTVRVTGATNGIRITVLFLFVIPLGFVLVPLTVWAVWLACYRRKVQNRRNLQAKCTSF